MTTLSFVTIITTISLCSKKFYFKKEGNNINKSSLQLSLNHIEKEINSINKQLKLLPDGDFYCTHNGKYIKWIHRLDQHKSCIPKKDFEFAQQLATRKYLSLRLQELTQEKQAIINYLKLSPTCYKSQELLMKPEYAPLIKNVNDPFSRTILDWMNAPYRTNPHHPDSLTHKTQSGRFVRSKSEAIIDMLLTQNNIPFRYECELVFDSITIYPDFTIKHPTTEKIYYWEHFGLMDNPTYAHNALTKLQTYISYGIIPNITLITTYETKTHPLTIDTVSDIISKYFIN